MQWHATIAGSDSRICGGVLTPGLWHHVAGTYNGSSFVLYLNGNLVASRSRSGAMALGTTPLVIGNNDGGLRGLDGLGRGGLADVEWTVQALQMKYGGRYPELRTPRTLEALDAARAVDVIRSADAEELATAWRLVSRVRNAITLVRGKPGDQLPRDAREKAAVASLLGYPAGRSDEMLNDYLRTTRRAHAVVERIFWG